MNMPVFAFKYENTNYPRKWSTLKYNLHGSTECVWCVENQNQEFSLNSSLETFLVGVYMKNAPWFVKVNFFSIKNSIVQGKKQAYHFMKNQYVYLLCLYIPVIWRVGHPHGDGWANTIRQDCELMATLWGGAVVWIAPNGYQMAGNSSYILCTRFVQHCMSVVHSIEKAESNGKNLKYGSLTDPYTHRWPISCDSHNAKKGFAQAVICQHGSLTCFLMLINCGVFIWW